MKPTPLALQEAGFQTVTGKCRPRELDLWLLASKQIVVDAVLGELAERLLPD